MEEAIECGNTRNLKADADMLLSLVHKSAWSEEDERKSLEIKCLIANYRTGNDEYELCSWIDKLKNRVQPKQEWNEEDEKMFKDIVTRLHSHPDVDKTEYDKSYHWLKSLRPQNTWKPSDEQMDNK